MQNLLLIDTDKQSTVPSTHADKGNDLVAFCYPSATQQLCVCTDDIASNNESARKPHLHMCK